MNPRYSSPSPVVLPHPPAEAMLALDCPFDEVEDGSISSTINVAAASASPCTIISKHKSGVPSSSESEKDDSLLLLGVVSQPALQHDDKPARKRVHFVEDRFHTRYDNTHMFKEDLATLWYDNLDYHVFRSERAAAAKLLANWQVVLPESSMVSSPSCSTASAGASWAHGGDDNDYGDYEEAEEELCDLNFFGYREMFEQMMDECCHAEHDNCEENMLVLSASCQHLVHNMMQMTNSPRLYQRDDDDEKEEEEESVLGLERLLAGRLRYDRQYRRRELTETLEAIQDDPFFVTSSSSANAADKTTREQERQRQEHERAFVIAHACRDITRPNRLWATHWARAVAASVQQTC